MNSFVPTFLLRRKRAMLVIAALLTCALLFTTCIDKKNPEEKKLVTKKGEAFAGIEACKSCHKNIYDSFVHTAHYFTSQHATEKTIKRGRGKDPDGFRYNYLDRVSIEQHEDSFYQVEYYNGAVKNVGTMDFTIGSGTRGQSYLSLRNNNLYQLPVSYFTAAHAWSNSPGFPDGIPKFNRLIFGRCLECHTTYATPTQGQAHEQQELQLYLGVSCERCHGPAARHVDYHSQNPGKTKGQFISNPASFSRIQSLDLCALCHSGTRIPTKPTFSFMAGDSLTQFFQAVDTTISTDEVDVHVNQYGLLTKSKCFLNSKTLSCQTCHNTHQQERGSLAVFSQRCISCHKQEDCHFCTANPSLSSALVANCIDCHMPVRESKILSVQLEGLEKQSPVKIRSHLIAIYPDDSKKILDFMNQQLPR